MPDLYNVVILLMLALFFCGWLGVLVCGILLLFSAYRNHRPKTAACITLSVALIWFLLAWGKFHLIRYRGWYAVCQSNLKQICLAVHMYRDDHNGQMPPNVAVILSNVNVSPRVFQCPAVPRRPDSSYGDLDYGYRFVAYPNSNDVIFWDIDEHRPTGGLRFFIPARRSVLYFDGHVEALDQRKFQMLNLSTNLVGATR